MTVLFPEIEPYAQGMLDVGDGNSLHWECSGNPQGKPALLLHGGPGTGSRPGSRRFFDPDAYRIIQYDQRGCGRSRPHAGDASTSLAANTTAQLLADIERLRVHLDIAQWLVFGNSWGTTLGLAYAEANPALVSALVLVGVTTTRRSEIDWLYRGMAPLFPAEWEQFRAGVPEAARDGDLIAAYRDLLADPDPEVRAKAALDFHAWEAASVSADPRTMPSAQPPDLRYLVARARIVTHYFHHHAWLEPEQLLRGAGALAGIPGVMVQGRLDLQAPLMTAWELARLWPAGRLVLVGGAGHALGDAGLAEAIIAATNSFR